MEPNHKKLLFQIMGLLNQMKKASLNNLIIKTLIYRLDV